MPKVSVSTSKRCVAFRTPTTRGRTADRPRLLRCGLGIVPTWHASAWRRHYRGQETEYVNGYTITPAGKKWLMEAGQYDYVPIEAGRFSKLLDSFSPRFGAGFQERSQEAIRCYGTNAYLGCSAMCGAAAESILLAVAIAKDGDQEKIEKAYLASGGRGRIEKLILGSQPNNIQSDCRGISAC